ncbi:uncharacterized protein CTHT_0021360 [Thermochaetoides thermophila DSM 1495]|uniref:SET domain-containing protein n=1 Tax=Chaetomium thermophilum (strain DSM 1495 / CBS 144.50 / IMI 039719) TaxID=759272 RepID=G0S8D5_CHATD|nr:hypothetical protein CTHT_0021360 [Thermochaetoides thermophila DSM 1495]EGS20310.1 hypothetical protein CTHT_0021360 [Thermochaetoides thermophila DSM 1495]
MARPLLQMLLLGLLAPLTTAAESEGSSEGLVAEAIDQKLIFASNFSSPITSQTPPLQGWWASKICAGPSQKDQFCIYTNRRVAKGRGMVVITHQDEFEKLEKMEDHLSKADNKFYDDPVPFVETPVLQKGLGVVANKTLRRNRPLMSFSPVLLVHRDFFDQVPNKKERAKMLDTAVSYLPPETLAKVNKWRQPTPEYTSPRSLETLLFAHPFEVVLPYVWRTPDAPHSRHAAAYPEVGVFQHDCRPNLAWYIDEHFGLKLTVARKTVPGEELTIAYIDPLKPTEERSQWVAHYRGKAQNEGLPVEKHTHHDGCPCKACSPPGGPGGEAAREQEKRLKEILAIRSELRNYDSTKVNVEMIEKFVKLVEQDRLHAKFAEAYELAALNFNYLGEDKKAKKYADLAVQAGIVEGGINSNDVVAMRIMASDIKGHYSYKYTLKRRGLAK